MNEEQVPKQGRGCFFYGCLTLAVLVVLGSVGAYFGVRYAIKKFVAKYTDTQPVALPKVQVSAEELQALQARVGDFGKALDAGTANEPLVLTENEINALIGGSKQLEAFKDAAYISLAGDQVKAQLSLPLERLGFERLRGRYLNGSATLKVSLEKGVLIVTLQSLQVKGLQPPDQVMGQLRAQNLARDVYKDPKNAEWMRKIEAVEVKDGRVMVKPALK